MLTKETGACIVAILSITMNCFAQVNPKEKFAAALNAIAKNYVDSVSNGQLVDAAISGMMKVLDPHSKYFSREEAVAMRESMKGSFAGIGVQFIMQQDSLYITQVISGGPAEKAGLLPGDRILSIDNEQVSGTKLSNYEVMRRIRGAKGSTISLLVQRKSLSTPVKKEIVRGAVPDKSVKAAYMAAEGIGYICLSIFNQTTRPEMDKSLIALKEKGMKSLILDLQGNGGGYVQAAIGVADEFLKKDQLVFFSVGKDKGKDYYYSGGFGQFPQGKLIVLIDEYTASASEILAGALQDWDRAVIVGRRSFGKGLMQRPVDLFDGSILELTGARYYTPSGRSIQKPYHGAEYKDNAQSRMESGELMNAGVIHFPDSLKYATLLSKRNVYGGGGIMPDKYVPIDTSLHDGWLQDGNIAAMISKIAFDYIDNNRDMLTKKYQSFNIFKSNFSVPGSMAQSVIAFAEKLGYKILSDNQDRVMTLLSLDIKAHIARQLFTGDDVYLQIWNEGNMSYQEALKLLRSNGYDAYLNKPAQ